MLEFYRNILSCSNKASVLSSLTENLCVAKIWPKPASNQFSKTRDAANSSANQFRSSNSCLKLTLDCGPVRDIFVLPQATQTAVEHICSCLFVRSRLSADQQSRVLILPPEQNSEGAKRRGKRDYFSSLPSLLQAEQERKMLCSFVLKVLVSIY